MNIDYGLWNNLSNKSDLYLDLKSIIKNKKIVSAIIRKKPSSSLIKKLPKRIIESANPIKKETTDTAVQVFSNDCIQSENQAPKSPEKIYRYSHNKVVSLKSSRFGKTINPSKSLILSTISSNNNIEESKNCFNNINSIINDHTNTIINSKCYALKNNLIERSQRFSLIKASITDHPKIRSESAFSTPKKYVNYMTKSEQIATVKVLKYKETIKRFQEDNKHLYLRFKYFNSRTKDEAKNDCLEKKYQGLFNIELNKSNIKFTKKKLNNRREETLSGKKSLEIIKLKNK